METSLEAFLTSFRTARGWSVRRLAEELGYKSATSLVRLAQGRASIQSAETLAGQIRQLQSEPPTDAELFALEHVLERLQVGDDEYRTTQLLARLLQSVPAEEKPVVIRSVDGGDACTLVERYRGKAGLHMLIFNCEGVPVFSQLAELEAQQSFPITHYLIEDGPLYLMVERLRAILPVLYDPNYQVFSRTGEAGHPMGILRSDLLFVGWSENGVSSYDVVSFMTPDCGFFMHYPVSMDRSLPMLLLSEISSSFRPLRLTELNGESDFAAYCAYCAQLELGRSVMRIKPDFGIEQVPVPVLVAAFRDQAGDELADAMIPELSRLFAQRQEHARRTRHPQYHIFHRKALWRFVRSGHLSDHPYLLRDFTVAERCEILRSIIALLRENPFYHLHIFFGGEVEREEELIYYEGYGLCLVKPHTDYHLGSGHAEIMLQHAPFLALYKRFYLDSLIRFHTLPADQTIALLGEMLRYLLDHPDGE